MSIVSVESAFCDFLNVSIVEIERIVRAHSSVNQGRVSKLRRTIWSKSGCCSIEVLVVWSWKIGAGAWSPIACVLRVGVGIVEAAKPMRTDVGCECPFTNPDWVLEIVGLPGDSGLIFVTSILSSHEIWSSHEGLIIVDVHGNLVHVVISEEVIPCSGIIVGG